jgi:hypothetical protein
MAGEHVGGAAFDHPADPRGRKRPLERHRGGDAVEHVADGGEFDENDRVWGIHASHSVVKNAVQPRKFTLPGVSGQAQFGCRPPPRPRAGRLEVWDLALGLISTRRPQRFHHGLSA